MLKNWIAYYFFLLASLAFALLYPGRASSALFYFTLALPPLSLCLLALMLRGFKYTQSVDRLAAAKGETVRYRLTARNHGILMLPYVELSFYSGAISMNDFPAVALAVPPLGVRTLEIAFACKYKGVCDIGVRQIKIRDFLGLFSFKQEVGNLGTLLVYPRIVPIESFPLAFGYDGDARVSGRRSRESAETVSEIRKYASGDRLRSIHWKLSAKREELMVKNYEQTSGAVAEIVLDACCAGRAGEDALILEDKLAECAVALAYHFASLSIPATLHYKMSSLVKQKLSSMGDFQLAYRMLSETSFASADTLKNIAELVLSDGVGRKAVVIVSGGLTLALCAEAMKLSSSGCMVAVVLADEEQGKPHDGAAGEDDKVQLLSSGVLFYSVGADEDIGTALMRKAI